MPWKQMAKVNEGPWKRMARFSEGQPGTVRGSQGQSGRLGKQGLRDSGYFLEHSP